MSSNFYVSEKVCFTKIFSLNIEFSFDSFSLKFLKDVFWFVISFSVVFHVAKLLSF